MTISLEEFVAYAIPFIFAAFYLGLFDRPPIQLDEQHRDLYAIVVPTTNLLDMDKLTIKCGQGIMAHRHGTMLHGGEDALLVTTIHLYFHETFALFTNKMAFGCVVDGSFQKVKEVAKFAQKASGSEEPVRAVRVPRGQRMLRVVIPYRNYLSVLSLGIHWRRTSNTFNLGGYKATNGRAGEESYVGMLVVATRKTPNGNHTLPFKMLVGDTKKTWDDAFPLEKLTTPVDF